MLTWTNKYKLVEDNTDLEKTHLYLTQFLTQLSKPQWAAAQCSQTFWLMQHKLQKTQRDTNDRGLVNSDCYSLSLLQRLWYWQPLLWMDVRLQLWWVSFLQSWYPGLPFKGPTGVYTTFKTQISSPVEKECNGIVSFVVTQRKMFLHVIVDVTSSWLGFSHAKKWERSNILQ